MLRRRTLAVYARGFACLLFAACAPALVQQRGTDLVPRARAPGNPEVLVRASPDMAQLGIRLATALAQGGMLVHLAPSALPSTVGKSYVVSVGDAANAEVTGVAGRVAIAPTKLTLLPGATQPLLLIRAAGATTLEPSARPLWELTFAGLGSGKTLSHEEEHSLFEAVVLWIRNRSIDDD